MDWSMVGALAALGALAEVPILAGLGASWKWARTVNRRLDRIEDRLGLPIRS